MDLSFNAKGNDEAERLLAVICAGLCVALEAGAISINEAENYLFSPATIYYLGQVGLRERAIGLVRTGTELEDFESLLLHKLNGAIDELKARAIEIIRAHADGKLPKEKWLSTGA